jgi:hypothetical protein
MSKPRLGVYIYQAFRITHPVVYTYNSSWRMESLGKLTQHIHPRREPVEDLAKAPGVWHHPGFGIART